MFWKYLIKAFQCFVDIVVTFVGIALFLILSAIGFFIVMIPILIPCGTVAFVVEKLLG